MGDVVQIHLHGRGHSGRAVRYKVLSTAEVDQVELLARGDLASDATILDFQVAVAKNGLERMVIAYTDPVSQARFKGVPVAEGQAVTALAWKDCGPAELSEKWASLFTARDTAALKIIYRREHVVTEEDVDLIMAGKVQATE